MINKTILLTGGTGSFGKAFVRRALEQEVKQIRIYSRDEFKQHEMSLEFRDPRVEYFLGDVRDLERLQLAAKGCDILIHAAAIKRIEKAERDPEEAIKTNIQGSINAAKAALSNNIEQAILISTDKACEPINLYGATKMVAEKFWIQANGYRGTNFQTKFTVVRYGNVVGSRGSVINAFKKQAMEGQIKITDPEMTRFFIELDSAVDLVFCALNYAQGGEVYIPDLKAAKILDLAKTIVPGVPVTFVGMQMFEKLHEQLYNQSEAGRIVKEDGYFIVEPENPKWPYKKEEVVTSANAEQYDLEKFKRV